MSFDLFWRTYEAAKAKLLLYLGKFLGLRDTILQLRRRIDRVMQAAQARGASEAVLAAKELRSQVSQAYDRQLTLEQRVFESQNLIKKTEAERAEQQTGQLGFVITGTMLAAVAVIAATAGAVVIHYQRVGYLNRLVDEIERKVLTPAEASALKGGLSLPGGLGGIGTLAIAGLAAFLLLRRTAR